MIILTTGGVTNNVITAAFDELKFHATISTRSIPLITTRGTQKYIENDYIGKVRHEYNQLIQRINHKYGLNFKITEIMKTSNSIFMKIEYNNTLYQLEL